MAVQRTLSIIKPDATANNVVGKIILSFRRRRSSSYSNPQIIFKRQVEVVHAVHKERPFFRRTY